MNKLPQDFNALLETMLKVSEKHIDKSIAKLLEKNPGISTPELMELVSRRYIRVSETTSAGVGGGAAVPGSGLVVGTALTGAELTVFATNTSLYVLTMARLSGIPTENLEVRKALVMSAVLGEEATKVVSDQIGVGLWNWARTQITENASATLGSVNKALANYAGKKISKKLSGHVVGRFIPFGIGAAIGFLSGRKLAQSTVAGVRAQIASLGAPTASPGLESRVDSVQPGALLIPSPR